MRFRVSGDTTEMWNTDLYFREKNIILKHIFPVLFFSESNILYPFLIEFDSTAEKTVEV